MMADDDPAESARTSNVTMTTRPLLMPESFSGKGSFSDWIRHFEGVAPINKWDDVAKLLWLRLVGAADGVWTTSDNCLSIVR